LDVGRKAPLKAGDETGFQLLDFARAAIARQHHLFTRLEEIVKGVKELFLDALFAREKLDIVNQQHVDMAVSLTELGQAILLQCLDKLVGEFFGRKVRHPSIGIVAQNRVANRVHEVGFAQAGVAVNEKRVVGLRGGLSDRQSSGVRHLVIRTNDKCFERVPNIERSGGGAAIVIASIPARGNAAAVCRLDRRHPQRGSGST